MCNHRNEEKELLLKLKEYFNDNNMLITYNGHSFDLPYLNARFKKHNIDFEFDPFMNFDLYRVVRSGKKSLGLDSYKLKSIELFLGIQRDDTISGKESVELYNTYEITQEKELKEKILLHNYEDIKFLIPTLKILEYIPEEITNNFYPYILKSSKYNELMLLKYEVTDSYVKVTFKTKSNIAPIDDYNENYTISIVNNDDSSTINITLPIFNIVGEEKYTFIDIDVISFINIEFNSLEYNEQLDYLLTNKIESSRKILRILEKY